jgi:hypothetical protein
MASGSATRPCAFGTRFFGFITSQNGSLRTPPPPIAAPVILSSEKIRGKSQFGKKYAKGFTFSYSSTVHAIAGGTVNLQYSKFYKE